MLAEHGDHSDVPALPRDTAGGDWCAAEILHEAWAGSRPARQPPARQPPAWPGTVHSLAREAFLQGLQGCAPRIAGSCAEEGLYGCGPSVQRLACTAAPDGGHVRARLRELASGPLTPAASDAANTWLAMLQPCEGA